MPFRVTVAANDIDEALLFHAGENDVATRRMLNSYNGKLRSYLIANKIMATPAFTTIPGRVIIKRFGYRAC